MNDFKIKAGYIERDKPEYCIDRPDGNLWQWDAYVAARDLANDRGAKWIIDLGCGSGEKARLLFRGFNYVGYDSGSNIAYCGSQPELTDMEWLETDLEHADFHLPSMNSVLICADVIEHLIDPEPLMQRLRELIGQVKGIIITTPERDLTHGISHTGPPPNHGHVREWNRSELRDYFDSMGFPQLSIRLIPCRKGDDRIITIMVVS